jgi:hypothetical protein
MTRYLPSENLGPYNIPLDIIVFIVIITAEKSKKTVKVDANADAKSIKSTKKSKRNHRTPSTSSITHHINPPKPVLYPTAPLLMAPEKFLASLQKVGEVRTLRVGLT